MSAPFVLSARLSVAFHDVSKVWSCHERRAGSGIGGKTQAERKCLAPGIGSITTNRYRVSSFPSSNSESVFLLLRLGKNFERALSQLLEEVHSE